jgi:hypothetical protein
MLTNTLHINKVTLPLLVWIALVETLVLSLLRKRNLFQEIDEKLI